MFTIPYFPLELDDDELTSLMVSVWDIIWMFTCDWLVGRLSVERDLTSCRELLSSVRLFSTIFVLMKTLEIYAELSLLIPNAVRKTFTDVTLKQFQVIWMSPWYWNNIISTQGEWQTHNDEPEDTISTVQHGTNYKNENTYSQLIMGCWSWRWGMSDVYWTVHHCDNWRMKKPGCRPKHNFSLQPRALLQPNRT